MLAFSFMIAMFPKQLQKKGSRNSTNSEKHSSEPPPLPHEEQPLTRAMLSDFMPSDPVLSKSQEKITKETHEKKSEGNR